MDTSAPAVHVEQPVEGVGLVELRRPPNNGLSVELVGALADGLDALAADPRCRAVVVAAEGKHFCAGAALSTDGDGGAQDGRHVYDEAVRLFECPLPIVMALHGAVVGGGVGLAMVGDLRVAAAKSTRLWVNFATLGFHHGFGLTVTLPEVVGRHRATQILLDAERLTADAALAAGLVDEVVDDDRLREAALDRARKLGAGGPLAARSIRATMRRPLVERVRTAMEHERREQDRLAATDDFAEGVRAVAERRPPRFAGR